MADIINATIEESKIDVAIEEVQIDVTLEGAIIEQQGGGNGGIPNGDKGDIVVSNAGTTWTIENMNENATVTTGTYSSKINQAVLIKARKASAGTITKGQVVYITGSSGTHLLVELAKANVEATSAYTIGIAATTITGSNDGFVMQNGRLTGLSTLPTATFDDGDALYLSEATAGAYRVGIPTAPNHGVFLGFAVKTSNGNAGEIDVRVDNYQELKELSDVYITGETTNDFLIRKATRWENTSLANTKTILAINNVDNTSDLNKPISTATQTALNAKENTITAGTTGQYYRGDKTFQTLDKSAVGLSNVDNTSDLNKPISTATQTALNNKVDKITGKGLSTEDYTTAEKNKLAGIDTGAQVNTVTSVAGKTGAVSLVKADVGLSNVDNTSDLNKPISTATQTALNTKQDNLGYTAENIANKGANNGYASLDNAGKVPTGQLPSYVDDVLEFANLAGFPITGETGKIYVAIDTGIIYRWSGSVYIEISSDTQAVWGNITGTLSNQTDLQNALNAKENTITAGTTGQYYRGDKTFQTLDKTAVGLGNVSNTDTTTTANITDSTNKRFITDAQQTVLTNTSNTNTGDQNLFSTIAVTGQSNVVADNTSDTLTLVAGSNITLTTNATNDEITIAGITYPQLLSAISLRI